MITDSIASKTTKTTAPSTTSSTDDDDIDIIPRQDRRGFHLFLPTLLALLFYSIYVKSIIGSFVFMTLLYLWHNMTKAPYNDPHAFSKRNHHRLTRPPTLVCLGDSLTHGSAISGDWVGMIPPYRHDWKRPSNDPLWVVNCGQNNMITGHLLKERVDWTLRCQPDYVVLLIGCNDCRAIWSTYWKMQLQFMWRENISFHRFEENFEQIIRRLVAIDDDDDDDAKQKKKVELAVCTLLPLGENLSSSSNDVIREANRRIRKLVVKYPAVTLLDVNERFCDVLEEKQKSGVFIPSPLAAPVYALISLFCRGLWGMSLDSIARITGTTLLIDGIHTTDSGAKIIQEMVLQWLTSKGLKLIEPGQDDDNDNKKTK